MTNWHHTPQSSNIARIAHDADGLHVVFKDGGHYVYSECPAAEFDAMRSSGSVGEHFHARIKGRYRHRRAG